MKMLMLSATALLLAAGAAQAGPHYGGGSHTYSHGGSYSGSGGSSHRGGHYTSSTGSHSYGTHR